MLMWHAEHEPESRPANLPAGEGRVCPRILRGIRNVIIVLFTCYLGLFNVYKALQRTFSLNWDVTAVMIVVGVMATAITGWAGYKAFNQKSTIEDN